MLRKALKINGIFSIVTGLSMILFNSALMESMAITESLVLPVIGAGVMIFGADVLWIATRNPLPPGMVKIIFYLDIAWVVGSIVLVGTNLFDLSTTGIVLVILVAAIVETFAVFQYLGLKRANQTSNS